MKYIVTSMVIELGKPVNRVLYVLGACVRIGGQMIRHAIEGYVCLCTNLVKARLCLGLKKQ